VHNSSGATVSLPIHYKFTFRGHRRWEVVRGVDFNQHVELAVPPVVTGGPAGKLTLKEGRPIELPLEPAEYDRTVAVTLEANEKKVFSAGVEIAAPVGHATGVVRLVGTASVENKPRRGGPTRTITFPLDRFFTDTPDARVAILGAETIGVLIEIKYQAEEAVRDLLRILPA
jgi:hypothetical protein